MRQETPDGCAGHPWKRAEYLGEEHMPTRKSPKHFLATCYWLGMKRKVMVFGDFLLMGKQEQNRLNKCLIGSVGKQVYEIVF